MDSVASVVYIPSLSQYPFHREASGKRRRHLGAEEVVQDNWELSGVTHLFEQMAAELQLFRAEAVLPLKTDASVFESAKSMVWR